MVKLGFGPNLTRFLGVREFTMGISSGLYMDFTGLKKNRADIYCYKSRFSKYSAQFSHSVMSDSLWPCGLNLQHDKFPCSSPIPRAYSNSCALRRWCHPTILSSVIPFSSCLQSFPESGSFLMSQFFASGGHSIGALASASVLSMNIQDWFPLGLTSLISLQFKWLSRVFSNTTVQKHQLKTPSKVCLGSLYILVK